MRVLFCNITWMDYYKGIVPGVDEPHVGVYCAKHPFHNFTSVVGWYKHATVYRNYCIQEFSSDDKGGVYEQCYNAIAKKEDCVLLPSSSRDAEAA